MLILLISPLFQFCKSGLIMSIYSYLESRKSLPYQENIKISMPGGLRTFKKDWYPFVMTFNGGDGFSNYISEDVDLTILYNFGAFDYLKGCSNYYNPRSNYYNAFYGAYITRKEGGAFGYYPDGQINFEEIAKIPEYDLKVLVLESIGCINPTYEFTMDHMDQVDEFLGIKGWDVMDATILTNSPLHQKENDYQAYIQYGSPPKDFSGENFEVIQVKGRIYARYFEQEEVTIFFYVIAPNIETIDDTDSRFLKTSKLELP